MSSQPFGPVSYPDRGLASDPALHAFVSAGDSAGERAGYTAADADSDTDAYPESASPGQRVTDLIERNPVPAALAAAAVGAGLVALVALLARHEREPRLPTVVPTTRHAIDLAQIKQQLADLSGRLGEALPAAAAKQRIDEAGDALAQGWGKVREHALDALDRALGPLQPQASAALKTAREHPVWGAMIVGAIGALVGSQWLGRGAAETPPATDATGDTAN